jgi:hypothetical protein
VGFWYVPQIDAWGWEFPNSCKGVGGVHSATWGVWRGGSLVWARVPGGRGAGGASSHSILMSRPSCWGWYQCVLCNIPFLCLGHRTYIGYMYLQYTQNNAVLQTFVQLLQSSRHTPVKKRGVYTAVQNQSVSRSGSTSPDHNGQYICFSTRTFATPHAGSIRTLLPLAPHAWVKASPYWHLPSPCWVKASAFKPLPPPC